MKRLVGIAIAVLTVVVPLGAGESEQSGMRTAFEQARRSAQVAGYSLSKVHRWLHEKALPQIDSATGLYRADGYWNYRDTAADCYPFFAWAAYVVDKDVLDGPVRDALHAEMRQCNHLDRIPVPWDFAKGAKVEDFAWDSMVFEASEYVKDGLIAIVEATGKDEWFERMRGIEEDLWKHAKVETPFGRIVSTNVEVNGEQLQALARLFTMAGDGRFLEWAERLGDYYLSQEDFVPMRLRDHGCEIIGGLGLLYAVESEHKPDKAAWYRPRLERMFDRILATGCNEDGIMYNHLTARDGSNGALSDGWGYNYVGYLCYDMAGGTYRYQGDVERALRNLSKPLYENYPWEGTSIDGFADSVEGCIYLINHLSVDEAIAWVDREMAANVVRSAEPLETAELWGTMKLQANGVRTVLMHALMHTQGLIARPWRRDLKLGAARVAQSLAVVIEAEEPWKGRLVFDIPRHRLYMGFKKDWPRMNTLPEWFTVEPEGEYAIRQGRGSDPTTHHGNAMRDGLELELEAGTPVRLLVRPR